MINRVMAGVLSLLCPGLGQFYNGNIRAAAAYVGAVSALTNAYSIVFTYVPPVHFWVISFAILSAWVAFFIWVANVIHAVFQKRSIGSVGGRLAIRRFISCVAFFVGGWTAMLTSGFISAAYGNDYIIEHSKVSSSSSMAPVLLPGRRRAAVDQCASQTDSGAVERHRFRADRLAVEIQHRSTGNRCRAGGRAERNRISELQRAGADGRQPGVGIRSVERVSAGPLLGEAARTADDSRQCA